MKYILATLFAISNAAAVAHHDDTFYEEYEVGGHSHSAEDDGSNAVTSVPRP